MNAIFTDASFQNIVNVANKYGISTNAVTDLTYCLMNSNGTMAQFNIPELGGGGQWMQGGMTMVGDMFNNNLKYLVDGLCTDLSNLIQQGAIQYKPLPKTANGQGGFAGNWWGNLGFPNSTGSQNDTSYAIFNGIHRLAIQQNGKVTIFDTLDHNIGGVGQQQGGNYSVSFTSQYGNVDLGSLPIVSGGNEPQQPAPVQNNEIQNNVVETPVAPIAQDPIQPAESNNNVNNSAFEEDIFGKIEKLAGLKDKGILSTEEFENKKIDLLNRL
ncbi:Short C-terminal domain-containing protein [Polaribacter sp. KT25b]|uniref:SHOCT domain-containing protein n=1 Tax=Polaribacter sp. KT25b TaxID=1855336 RepID=UPI00087973C3|nr:SHOCT domain-containing protein [Polaribacter sp. KT25b]SDR92272.1 Short C-terminal domain-containing protein [Polaribacter sp. KT25b]